jgi:hypothetical protein
MELSDYIIRVTRIGELATLALTRIVPGSPIFVTLRMGALSYFETSALIRATRRNIPEDAILRCSFYFLMGSGCETWSLTVREEHKLRVFENRLLRRIFGPKRNRVTGGWRKLHNEELHNLYSSPSIIRIIKSRRMRWA